VIPLTITSGGAAGRRGVARAAVGLNGEAGGGVRAGSFAAAGVAGLAGHGGAGRAGRASGHDDLVFALALAVWRGGGVREHGRYFRARVKMATSSAAQNKLTNYCTIVWNSCTGL